jgi:hypothetical protein
MVRYILIGYNVNGYTRIAESVAPRRPLACPDVPLPEALGEEQPGQEPVVGESVGPCVRSGHDVEYELDSGRVGQQQVPQAKAAARGNVLDSDALEGLDINQIGRRIQLRK